MRAILINAEHHLVSEVEYDGNIDTLNKLIGSDCFTTAGAHPNNDTLFVDDEGLLKNPQVFFQIESFYPVPLAGNGVILGCNDEGESVGAKIALQTIKDEIIFLDAGTVALMAKLGAFDENN